MLIRLVFLCCVLAGSAVGQTRQPSHCIALANLSPEIEYLLPTNLPQVAEQSALIHYIAHASFLIRSRGGLNIVTDFTGFIGSADMIPDIVTMNHAHETHYTN